MYSKKNNQKTVRKGDVFYVNSIYSEVGSEMKSGRPAVVVSSDEINESDLGVVEVCYLTLRDKKRLPTRVTLTEEPCDGSTILCEQITTVSKERLGDFITHFDSSIMVEVNSALANSLDLGFDYPSEDEEEDAEMRLDYTDELTKYKAQATMYKNMYESMKKTFDEFFGGI